MVRSFAGSMSISPIGLTLKSMDDELGAVAASERSELAVTVTSLAVHWIDSLGSMMLALLKLRCCDGLRTALISVIWFLLSLTDDFGLRRCDTGEKR